MYSLQEQSKKLASPQNVDPKAFLSDSKVSVEVCALVMALALFFNDLRDAVYAYLILMENKPGEKFQRTVEWGNHTGMQIHLIRYHLAVLHELFKLIRSNSKILEDPFLKEVLRNLSKQSKRGWETLVTVSLGGTGTGSLAQALVKLRNNITFHYEAKAILSGFERHFLQDGASKEVAVLSRGDSIASTRFYFADAAAQGSIQMRVDEKDKLFQEVHLITREAMPIVGEIVSLFVTKRGYAFRSGTT